MYVCICVICLKILLVRWFIIRVGAWASMHNLLMFCHGTQTMDNTRICHCLLFHEHSKQNLVQPFCLSRKLLCYTHTWTKLHKEVMSWISGAVYMSVIMHGPYLKRMQLLCMICQYRLWAACPCPCHGLQSHFHRCGVSSPNRNLFSTCANLKPVRSI